MVGVVLGTLLIASSYRYFHSV